MKKLFILSAFALVLGAKVNAQVVSTSVCANEQVCLITNPVTGTVQWEQSSDMTTWTPIAGATTDTFCLTPVNGHYYRARVTVVCGDVFSDTTQVTVNALPTVDAGSNLGGVCTDVFTIGGSPTASGGLAPYTYAWTSNETLSSTTVANPDMNGINENGWTYVTVTDANGCSATDSLSTTELPYTATYNFTGAMETFSPNPCFAGDTMLIQCWGAQGGSGAIGGTGTTGGVGGLGGYAEGYVVVGSGTAYNVFVGGQGATPTGGFNGGANGGTANAGGGGGATDVRVGGTAESDRIITAGGGGGGGRGGCHEGSGTGGNGGTGGAGGGGVGTNGADSPQSSGVAGGGFGGNQGSVQGQGGALGIGCPGFSGTSGVTATTGTGGTGGTGQACCCSLSGSVPGGGGGGGGQLGGGGGGGGSAGTSGCGGNSKGAGGGGGGGSSFNGGTFGGTTNSGIWLGDGMVTFTVNP